MNAYSIRPATPADAAGIARTVTAGWQQGYRGILPPEFLAGLSAETIAERWRRTLEQRGAAERILVAVDGEDNVAGVLSILPARDRDVAGAGEVAVLYVHPDRWRLGLGSSLMAAAIDAFRLAGYEHAVLWVLEDNKRGRRFYERVGWLPDGARRLDEFGGASVAQVRYALPLAELVE